MSAQQLESVVFIGGHRRADLIGAEILAGLVPGVARCDRRDVPGADQFFKVPPRIRQHVRAELANIGQERLPVKRGQTDLVQHEMIDRCVGKAEKNFVRHGFLQCIVLKEIRRKPVGVVAADGAEDHVHLGVAEGGEQIRCPRLGMRPQVCHAHLCVRHVFDGQSKCVQAFFADFQLMRDKGFTEHAARQADNSDCFHHDKFSPVFFFRATASFSNQGDRSAPAARAKRSYRARSPQWDAHGNGSSPPPFYG